MIDNLKKILNEDQDPKAIEKITAKLESLLMKNEEVGYIGVQKKPAITVLPDSIVMTNKRIIVCKPKNLGLSMDFIDYDWDDIAGAFVKENILGSEFSFSTKTELVISIDYIPKNQARKLHTFAKEQIDLLKNPVVIASIIEEITPEEPIPVSNTIPYEEEIIEELETEEVTNFSEIMSVVPTFSEPINTTSTEKKLADFSQDELFEKLQNYKKLLDNGLILQGEYDTYKKEILSYM
ncbi:PH domain-containing protein [Flavobacterium psychrophilum]|uniref:PH domain-containing protein n=1 Tax=Flavobacterium psychrophilum TaxID=96345 RepID=UPI001D08E9AE|nr:PH domain-containing protein [Flavobacterium psychrophilum]ELY1991268.1 PH domain-containing protein [Flavobacterium psychrophilum]MCB6098565.1 PH domain-containing protein [Flavobacterium psychrophilum]MCB6230894.1 PH domain-containing protein [Flavobacterium psychrophilum]